ncbi:MAG: hypothetical protein DMF61_23850 [Blastocatellia bacterium AA13]|nr:MAG: hypothetical protein DMF61_23850 [Blastocatellia bacterium AA13]
MHVIKFFLGVVGSILAFVVAIKLLGLLLFLVGLAVKLVWLAIIVGIVTLIAWALYKLLFPNQAEQL